MPEVSTGLLMEIVQVLDNIDDCRDRASIQDIVDRIMVILEPYQ